MAAAVLTAGAVMALPLFGAVLVYIVAAGVWTSGATLAFTHALSLPLTEPLLAGLVSLGAATGFRFLVADRDRRFLRKSFALYLAPAGAWTTGGAQTPPAPSAEPRQRTPCCA